MPLWFAEMGSVSFVPRASILLVALVPLLLGGCSIFKEMEQKRVAREEALQLQALRAAAKADHDAFRAGKNWRSKTYRNATFMALATPATTRIHISIKEQRGYLIVSEAIAMEFPVATGKSSHPTPTGDFTILGKTKDYHSNLYGKIVDPTGAVIVSDADTRRDAVPEGGRFQGAPMLYWMRLTNTGVGLHVGYVPGRPASHGCIRLPAKVAPVIFGKVKVGTPVVVSQVAPTLPAGTVAPQPRPRTAVRKVPGT